MSNPHGSLVIAALDALDDHDVMRHLCDLNRMYLRLVDSPGDVDVDFELCREAMMRKIGDDPTWAVWAAWVESRRLAREAAALWRAQE